MASTAYLSPVPRSFGKHRGVERPERDGCSVYIGRHMSPVHAQAVLSMRFQRQLMSVVSS